MCMLRALRWVLFLAALAAVAGEPQQAASQRGAHSNVGRLFFHDGISAEQLWNAETNIWFVPVRSERLRELQQEAEEIEDWESDEDEPEQSILIAVVDSGILSNHPVLRGRIAAQEDFTGEGLEDRSGHGTYVALALAQATPPTVQLLVAKVAGKDGTVHKDAFIRALLWAADRGASIAYAYVGFVGDALTHHDLCEAIEEVHDLTIFAAAGTLGPDVDVFPAHCDGHAVIAVGCSGPDGKPLPSSGRATIYGRCDVRLEPYSGE